MKIGKQSWIFNEKPVISAAATVAGPFEANGKLANEIDLFHKDLYMNQPTYEQAHQQLIEDATKLTVQKADLRFQDIDFFISGDLINQMTPTNFASRTHKIPFIGSFNACATSAGSLALAALMVNYKSANYVITGAASHNAAVEKQFRYPTEYGAQKPPTAQWTVTGAGFGLVSQTGTGPVVTRATIGRVIDLNQSDPFNMGAAMAPAAADTLKNHLKDHQLTLDHYDLIVTGDLGEIGRNLLIDILRKEQIYLKEEQLIDAGLSIYSQDQNVFSGGSGTGCSALYLYSQLYRKLSNKELNRILFIATGALLSPLSTLQNQSIPVIAHAVAIESEGV
ncbi:stage V sporulation protein AD [Amphibacillus xylanus]|uniref:Stage V sporulation protein AD n=1 Tax=Amphibacillus xylanus (strain ATCC 51415 / DSM 6626 / JCM 7361 / LMG 17667 / NBRC 15112 / Ep01) TaxID=698758 RepID=K0J7Q4_AMPXN|nr:stage V sporulation protein AD [Amphibacillus xylanus]BAM47773.1 stage V sporulation protein AD [Amphibacillus xylanus NBRC 15112]